MKVALSIKKFLPTGLYTRSLLIIILPVALMQVLITWVFFDSHWQSVSRRMSEGVAGDVALIVEAHARNPSTAAFAQIAADARDRQRLSVALQQGAKLPTGERRATFAPIDRVVRSALEDALDAPFWFDTTRYPDYVDIRVQTREGVIRVLAYRDRMFAATGELFLFWVIGATAILTTVSVLFIRNQVKPIERLAEAAERFGRGGPAMDFKPAGAREVRRAAAAFLDMRARIQRHLEQRTQLLAGVSHDLRTPLTRLKLQLALMPEDEDVAAARADLAAMEGMLDEYLAFARGQWIDAPEDVDIAALAEAAVEGARRGGAAVELASDADLVASARGPALRRALDNLIDNAASHGGKVAVEARRRGRSIVVAVEDDGPGIAPERYEEAFKPFSRLDPARNQNRKGVGLGLAIARDIARAHGGDLTLDRSALGGLKASLRLPAAGVTPPAV